MNSYERYVAVMKGEKADILPRLPILMQFAAEHIGSNYGAFASDYRVLVEANLRCAEEFGFDQVSAISDPYRETQGFGAAIRYVRDGVPRCVKPPLEDAKDLKLLKKPNPRRSERMLDRVRAVEAYTRAVHRKYSVLGWVEGPAAEAADLRGVTSFLMDLVLDAPFARELMARCIEVGIAFAKAQIDAGADTIGVGDAIASQLSPDLYAEMVFPYEQRLFEGIRAAGGLIRLHICGDTTHLVPYFARLPVDIVDLDWQMDMAKARGILGTGKVMVGNLDPVNAVKRGTPAKIRKALRDLYRAVGNPFMAGAGCEIPPGTANENLKALCEPVPYKRR
ncbi:MAG TPA: uroporphyrinogen decarboxylase family protein [Planctomycetota bacterium]|nr:uroporphyrinogen decarboxylase family protein [Planctomycetota bacterium]